MQRPAFSTYVDCFSFFAILLMVQISYSVMSANIFDYQESLNIFVALPDLLRFLTIYFNNSDLFVGRLSIAQQTSCILLVPDCDSVPSFDMEKTLIAAFSLLHTKHYIFKFLSFSFNFLVQTFFRRLRLSIPLSRILIPRKHISQDTVIEKFSSA